MSLSQQEASAALDAVAEAGQRVRQYQGYRETSPFLILWGVLWFIGNLVTHLAPRHGGTTWIAITAVGALVTTVLVVKQSQRAQRQHQYSPSERAEIGRRVSLLGCSVMAFFPSMFVVLGPLSGIQTNAFISLFWALAYMAAGAWLGLRLFFTGLATLAAVLVGVLLLREHYFLWMAFAGAGSLLLGGLWLRRL